MSAEELGKKLLAEVEEVGFDEILNSLRTNDDGSDSTFGFAPLDGLLQAVESVRGNSQAAKPLIELTSIHPTGGKTHLLYHLTAIAVLPTELGGKHACVVVLDTDSEFAIPRLAQQIKNRIKERGQALSNEVQQDVLVTGLKHVHIFHPQSLSSTVATVETLPDYLFNPARHQSFDRAVSFIALDSAFAFYWQARADAEDAQLLAATSKSRALPLQSSSYADLSSALQTASAAFNCPLIYTTRFQGPNRVSTSLGTEVPSFRPSLPPSWQFPPVLRLIVRRLPVRKLPVEITAAEALKEADLRQRIVEKGKFECFVNEWGLDHATLQKVRRNPGFEFWITDGGVRFEQEDVQSEAV